MHLAQPWIRSTSHMLGPILNIVITYSISLADGLLSTNKLSAFMEKLESVQTQAAYAVAGAWKGSSAKKVYNELGWEWLTQRRWYPRMTLFYKITHKVSPKYLTDCITYPDPPILPKVYVKQV